MSAVNTSPSWNVGRASGQCAACARQMPAGTACWATLCDGIPLKKPEPAPATKGDSKSRTPAPVAAVPFFRVDFCEACWDAGKRPDHLPAESIGHSGAHMFSYWKTSVPAQEQKKKLLVDDAVLMDVFTRMEGKTEPQEIRFRFVLALILMRKRLLKYEATETGAPATPENPKPPETWRMLPKATEGWGAPVAVINPHLTADQIAEVSQQLSAILAEEI